MQCTVGCDIYSIKPSTLTCPLTFIIIFTSPDANQVLGLGLRVVVRFTASVTSVTSVTSARLRLGLGVGLGIYFEDLEL